MIAETVRFLRGRLNQALQPVSPDAAAEELVVYAKSDRDDMVTFKAGAVSMLLIGLEEDKTLRPPDLYSDTSPEGARQKRIEPEIRMSLHLLLVARFPDDYGRALHYLSGVIRYFQKHRVFNQDNSPDLDPGIAKLILELTLPSFAEQNEIWSVLRAPLQPSALYKARLVLFRDETGTALIPVKQIQRELKQQPVAAQP